MSNVTNAPTNNIEYKDYFLQVGSRFSGTAWSEKIKEFYVNIIGLGGIGSYTCYNIGRLSPNYMTLIDPDKIDLSNYSGQLFSISSVGQYKVEACKSMLINMCNYYKVTAKPTTYEESNTYLCKTEIVILGLDNMSSRKDIFSKWLKHNKGTDCIFIDGRMSIDTFQIYCVLGNNKHSIDRYKETLFSDDEADKVVCSLKQTSFIGSIIGGMIANITTIYANYLIDKECNPSPPFKIEFDGNNLDFTVEI